METNYLTAVAGHGASLITHIGLLDETDTEITGGTYARQAVTWVNTDGVIRPDSDLVFDVPSGNTVGSWAGYSASTAGTFYGGGDLTDQAFSVDGTYTLQAAGTGIAHVVGA